MYMSLQQHEGGQHEGGHSHMNCHVVWGAISICICDVINSTDCHNNLPDGVHDGQVDDRSGGRNVQERLEIQWYLSFQYSLITKQPNLSFNRTFSFVKNGFSQHMSSVWPKLRSSTTMCQK